MKASGSKNFWGVHLRWRHTALACPLQRSQDPETERTLVNSCCKNLAVKIQQSVKWLYPHCIIWTNTNVFWGQSWNRLAYVCPWMVYCDHAIIEHITCQQYACRHITCHDINNMLIVKNPESNIDQSHLIIDWLSCSRQKIFLISVHLVTNYVGRTKTEQPGPNKIGKNYCFHFQPDRRPWQSETCSHCRGGIQGPMGLCGVPDGSSVLVWEKNISLASIKIFPILFCISFFWQHMPFLLSCVTHLYLYVLNISLAINGQ